MAIWDKIKSSLMEDETPAPTATPTKTATKLEISTTTPANTYNFLTVPPIPTVGKAQVDMEIVSALNAATERSKNGAYTKFLSVLAPLNGIPQAQRYPIALNVLASANNIQPTEVVASIDERLAILDGQKAEAMQGMHDITDKEVVSRKKQVEEWQARIVELTIEIDRLRKEITQCSTEAQQHESTIGNNLATFEESFKAVQTGLTNERDTINALIPKT